jgi:hypothetical protein
MRFNSAPHSHHCQFTLLDAPQLTQSRLDRWAALPLQQRAQAEIASLTALTDAPLSIVEDGLFQRIVNGLVDIGRDDPEFRFGPGGCPLSRYRTRKVMIEESTLVSEMIVASYAKRPCVSLAIDAGTIERRHFLDLMILAPYSRLKPFLYDSLENERLTSEDYGELVAQTIEELKGKGVLVRSIVGDNLPAQIVALAHWSTRSRLRGKSTFLNGVKYSPCLCHFMQLIVSDCIANVPSLQGFETLLQDVIAIANSADVCEVTRARCPQSVKTRWLSRSEALRWLLARQQIFLNIASRRFQKSRREKFQQLISEENFQKLSMYHQFLHPCTQAVKFFEQDSIALCHVYPALKTLKQYFKEQAVATQYESPELSYSWSWLTDRLHFRQRKLLDRDLMKVAFWLTSFGCTWLADRNELISRSHQLQLTYEAPRPVSIIGPLEASLILPANTRENAEECEEDAGEHPYLGDEINDESLEEASAIDVPKGETLTFVCEILVKYLREETPAPEVIDESLIDERGIESLIRSRVNDVLMHFFCSDEYTCKCRDTAPAIDKQIELWNFLARNSSQRVYDDIIAKIISIISIPASEASCERSFSRQKRIMGHSRVRSNSDLLRARFLLKGERKE